MFRFASAVMGLVCFVIAGLEIKALVLQWAKVTEVSPMDYSMTGFFVYSIVVIGLLGVFLVRAAVKGDF